MTFYETITAAIHYFEENGFESEDMLAYWSTEIRKAAGQTLLPEDVMVANLRKHLTKEYTKVITEMSKPVSGRVRPKSFTLANVSPKLRKELDRRIMASANLIKLNREEAISNTLRRFEGWATSIPVGGSDAIDKQDTKRNIKKSLNDMTFIERRVVIDQGHKLNASLREIIAVDNGAIAIKWHSHWRRPGYNYRKDHKERDLQVYALRDSWAKQQGLMKAGPAGYYDQITSVGEEVYCSCYGEYIYYLHNLPDDMLTAKGREYGTVSK